MYCMNLYFHVRYTNYLKCLELLLHSYDVQLDIPMLLASEKKNIKNP